MTRRNLQLASKLVIRLQMNFTKGYFQMTFFVKNSKYLPKYHPNLFPKSRFSKYINPCLVILFCEVQNQNKQKCASRYLYQNNNKRLHFLTQTSPKSFLKISVYLVKNVKSGKTFICWEPYNKLVWKTKSCVLLKKLKKGVWWLHKSEKPVRRRIMRSPYLMAI